MNRFFFYIGFVLLLTACGRKEAPEAATNQTEADTTLVVLTPDQIKNAAIVVDTPRPGSSSNVLTFQGLIDVPPQSMVSISFPLGGYLKSTNLLPGMPVKKGQVIGVLEDIQYIQLQQDYLSARARLQLAEAEFDRQQQLNETKASSDKVFQQAKMERETQRILTRSLEEKLELIGIRPKQFSLSSISRSVNIYSPINGFVSKVNVNIGKYVSPTDVMFELINPSDIHLTFTAFEKDIDQLAIGQKVITYTNQDPKEHHEASILLISRNLDRDGGASVHCHFEDFHTHLLPGMFMNVEVHTTNRAALLVNENAVVRWQNRFYVFVAKGNNRFEMTQVKAGTINDGWQAIEASGIGTGTRLVTGNAYALLMKMKNNAEEAEE